MCLLITSRRSGKTDLLTIIVAILLIVLSNLEVLCWSLYNQTAEIFGRTVIKWIVDLGYGHCARVGKDHITFRYSEGDVRTVYMMGSQNENVSYYYISFINFMILTVVVVAGGAFIYIYTCICG